MDRLWTHSRVLLNAQFTQMTTDFTKHVLKNYIDMQTSFVILRKRSLSSVLFINIVIFILQRVAD